MKQSEEYSPATSLKDMVPKEHYKKGSRPYFVPIFGAMFSNRLNAAVNHAVQHLPPDGAYDILEIGSGFGQFTTMLGTHYRRAHIVALDIMFTGLPFIPKLAERYGVAEAAPVQADAMCLPFAPESFDAIFSMDTLEHVPNPAVTLKEMSKVLRPGGKVFVMVPVEAMWLRTARAFYWKWTGEHYAPYHWQGTIKNVNDFSKLMHNDFDIVEEFHYPFPLMGREFNYERIIFGQKHSR